ncbi:ComF family protein [Nicoliella lavandulae]|uniref:ComF family protein n=1 Tax=Nicoliella lavandulae TaxID=3082954 RepID=A0ABU8SK18_9LACO
MHNCLLCQKPLNQAITIEWLLSLAPQLQALTCADCKRQFHSILNLEQTCPLCNRVGTDDQVCGDCKDWEATTPHGFINQSLYEYNDAMKEFMHRYKFVGDYQLRKVFATEFSQVADATKRVVVPIPLTNDTLARRTFNQTTGLLNGPFVDCLATIEQIKTKDQSAQNRLQRKSISQPFKMKPDQKRLIQDQNVLVVDDVYTTGTTIRFAASLLMQNGAKTVNGLTLAR